MKLGKLVTAQCGKSKSMLAGNDTVPMCRGEVMHSTECQLVQLLLLMDT